MELFTMYSLSEIVAFLVILGSSIVGFTKFCSFCYGYISKFLDLHIKKHDKEEKQEETLDKLFRIVQDTNDKITHLENEVRILKESDKDDIKSYITEKYHQYYKQKWIDDYALQCVEARYTHYKEEGGNSFIETLMGEIRNLPKEEPIEEE